MLAGQGGDDVMIGGAGNDRLNGGEGFDTVSYAGAASLVRVNLGVLAAQNTLGAGIDVLAGFENLTGSGFNDILTGDAGFNILDGGAGNDTVNGGAGDDTILGSAGDDRIEGGPGTGAEDLEVLDHSATLGGITLDLSLATAQATGGSGSDTVTGIEAVIGTAANDVLNGSAGDDFLVGGAGDNQVNGANGDDYVSGGPGNDVLTGGAGADQFRFAAGTAAGDTITDFSGAQGDALVFAGYGAGASFTQIDAAHWRVSNAAATIAEIITFSNNAAILAGDVTFV